MPLYSVRVNNKACDEVGIGEGRPCPARLVPTNGEQYGSLPRTNFPFD